MQQTTINGYQVIIFTGYHGTQLFITHPEGYTIYAHKVSGGESSAMERAREVINADAPAPVAAPAPVIDRMLCLSDRKDEFKQAIERGLAHDLEVHTDVDDAFFVVNRTNNTEYRVRFETRGNGKNYVECACRDFSYRRRICKHVSEVLADRFFGAVESFGVVLNG